MKLEKYSIGQRRQRKTKQEEEKTNLRAEEQRAKVERQVKVARQVNVERRKETDEIDKKKGDNSEKIENEIEQKFRETNNGE